MTVLNPPGFLQNAGATHTAEQTRDWLNLMLNGQSASAHIARGGVNPYLSNKLQVTQTGSPSMAVIVRAGYAAIPGTEGTKQGTYFVGNDADVTLTVTAAHATLARIDIVVFRVRDTAYSGANNDSLLEVVAGTPAGSPSPPTAPANSITLAHIAVAAAVTSIVNANITDKRVWLTALGGVEICTSTTRPSIVLSGTAIWETDVGGGRLVGYDGTNWRALAWGTQPYVYVRRTTTQSITTGTTTAVSWTSEVSDRSGLFSATSDTFTCPTNYDGVWHIDSFVKFANNTTGVRVMSILVNGAVVTEDRRDPTTAAGTQPTDLHATAMVLLAATDTVQITVFQGSGGNLNIDAGSDAQNPKLMLTWIGR